MRITLNRRWSNFKKKGNKYYSLINLRHSTHSRESPSPTLSYAGKGNIKYN